MKKDSLPALKWVADLLKKYEVAGDVEVSRMVSSLYANGHTNEAALLARIAHQAEIPEYASMALLLARLQRFAGGYA